jgi:hypothetical protein
MNRLGILLLLGAVLGSCNERDFRRSEWFDGGPDTILDGAMRISTWTSRDERYLTIRCFRFKADSEPKYDLRYEIDMPLLERADGTISISPAQLGYLLSGIAGP